MHVLYFCAFASIQSIKWQSSWGVLPLLRSLSWFFNSCLRRYADIPDPQHSDHHFPSPDGGYDVSRLLDISVKQNRWSTVETGDSSDEEQVLIFPVAARVKTLLLKSFIGTGNFGVSLLYFVLLLCHTSYFPLPIKWLNPFPRSLYFFLSVLLAFCWGKYSEIPYVKEGLLFKF